MLKPASIPVNTPKTSKLLISKR